MCVQKYCSADFELVIRFETRSPLVVYSHVFFLSHGPLTSTRKEIKYKFFIIILLYFRVRYSKTTKFLHLVHNEIRWRQDSTVLAAVRTAGASTVCKETICIMASYTLSLTVVVVDPRRLDLVCRKNGEKNAGKPAGQKRCWDEHDKNNVAHGSHGAGASFTLKPPKLFTATSRQLEMYLPYICYSYVHFLKDECKELLDSLFQQCKYFSTGWF